MMKNFIELNARILRSKIISLFEYEKYNLVDIVNGLNLM